VLAEIVDGIDFFRSVPGTGVGLVGESAVAIGTALLLVLRADSFPAASRQAVRLDSTERIWSRSTRIDARDPRARGIAMVFQEPDDRP